jgi:hypothetical protein
VSFFVGVGSDGLITATTLLSVQADLPVYVGLYLLPLRHPVPVAPQLASIAELAPGRSALFTYARLPFESAAIAAEAWCEDLCELLAWEEWGLLHRHETKPFAQIHGQLADHAERSLLALADELRSRRPRHQADQALANIAYLHIAAGRLTSFAPAAARLGSDHWMPIVALAQAAIARDRHDIAREVFAAAGRPGLQRDQRARPGYGSVLP